MSCSPKVKHAPVKSIITPNRSRRYALLLKFPLDNLIQYAYDIDFLVLAFVDYRRKLTPYN